MSDIKFSVVVDSASGQAQIKEFEGKVDGLGKTGEAAGNKFAGAWKQIALGQVAFEAAKKAGQIFLDFMGSCIKGAMDEEQSQLRLKTALDSTGRSTKEMLPDLQAYAVALSKQTLYTHEDAEGSMTLLTQLTNLNSKGIKEATKGAMGLASTLGIDLHSATMMVTGAMDGNTAGLKKAKIQIDDTLKGEELQAEILRKLKPLYEQSTAATQTFSGRMQDLKKWIDEGKEALGAAIVKNKDFNKLLEDAKKAIITLIESGELEEWANKISRALTFIVSNLDILKNSFEKTFSEGMLGNISALSDRISGVGAKAKELEAIGRKEVAEFKKSLQVLTPTTAELRAEIEKGRTSWEKYKTDLTETDKKLAANKDTIKGWMTTGLGFLGLQDKHKKSINETGTALGHLTKLTDEQKKAQEAADKILKILNSSQDKTTMGIRSIIVDQGTLTAAWKLGVIDTDSYRAAMERLQAQIEAVGRDAIKGIVIPATRDLMAATKICAVYIQDHAKDASNAWSEGGETTAEKWKKAMAKVSEISNQVLGQLNTIFSQANTNRLAEIDNEYNARKKAILAGVGDEVTKNARLENLDKEFEVKRRDASRTYAKEQKAVALMEATVNTASAFVSALRTPPPWVGIAYAAAVGALGAIRIGLIAAQPIPLAKGAIFKRPTILTADTGSQYQVAEGGEEEILSSPKQLRAAIMSGGRTGVGAGRRNQRTMVLRIPINIGGTEIREEIIKIIMEADGLGKLKLKKAFA